MLQVVTKKYFGEGVPLHTTEHRRVLYSNRHVVTEEAIDLPVGSLQAAASLSASPFAFTATAVEHLEAKEADGSDAVLIATSGDELIDDLAAVLSFRTNSLFSRDIDLVRRLLSPPNGRDRGSARALFKDTFDADRFLPDAEIWWACIAHGTEWSIPTFIDRTPKPSSTRTPRRWPSRAWSPS
jgi:hypothetical protein